MVTLAGSGLADLPFWLACEDDALINTTLDWLERRAEENGRAARS